jgi:hypothetical protein
MWVPFVWWAALLGSVFASMAGDQSPPCTAAEPCQPDVVFPMVLALVGLSAAAVWWLPRTALLAGLAYAALGVVYDPSPAGRYAEVLVGCLAAALLLLIRALRARQAELARRLATGGEPVVWSGNRLQGRRPPRGPRTLVVPAIGVAGLLLLAGSAAGYQHQRSGEASHLARADRVEARVVSGADDDLKQLFEIVNGPRAGTKVPIETFEELPRGGAWPVLLDPADRDWVRLVSEPQGFTHWFGWGLLGACAAGWALLHEVGRKRAGRAGAAGQVHQVRVDSDGMAELVLTGHAYPVATVWTAAPPPGRRYTQLQSALLFGPVCDGGWVRVETANGPIPLLGPLRSLPRWRDLGVNVVPSVDGRLLRGWDAVAVSGRLAWRGLLIVLGGVLVGVAVHQAGPAWAAAHGHGVPGQLTVMSRDCSGKGGCTHRGDFRSTDGQYAFDDVDLIGAGGDVGATVPALYVGESGRTPDAVYGPGWGGLVESVFFLGAGVMAAGEPVLQLAMFGRARWRRAPRAGDED